jgi:hypothetical protein
LESHPLVVAGDRNLAAEPFLPAPGVSLADLARHSLDVSNLQERFFDRYLDWQLQRLRAIMQVLSLASPPPGILVFPEGAVPLEFLYELRNFSQAHGTTIFAGTHSLRATTSDSAHYKALGVRGSEIKRWEKIRAGTALLPILTQAASFFRPKQHSSVFEITGTASDLGNSNPIDTVQVSFSGHVFNALPLVCADALHTFTPRGNYDLVVIVAYNRTIDPFLPLINQSTFNRIPVLFCNDGRFGGSCVAVSQDQRMDTWWWSSPRNGRLRIAREITSGI